MISTFGYGGSKRGGYLGLNTTTSLTTQIIAAMKIFSCEPASFIYFEGAYFISIFQMRKSSQAEMTCLRSHVKLPDTRSL